MVSRGSHCVAKHASRCDTTPLKQLHEALGWITARDPSAMEGQGLCSCTSASTGTLQSRNRSRSCSRAAGRARRRTACRSCTSEQTRRPERSGVRAPAGGRDGRRHTPLRECGRSTPSCSRRSKAHTRTPCLWGLSPPAKQRFRATSLPRRHSLACCMRRRHERTRAGTRWLQRRVAAQDRDVRCVRLVAVRRSRELLHTHCEFVDQVQGVLNIAGGATHPKHN